MSKFRHISQRTLKYFYYQARPKLINPLNYLRLINEGTSVIELRNKHPKLFREICGFIYKSNSFGCEWSDYLVIYREIRKLKSQNVLELGSGVTSIVIAFALEENLTEYGIAGKLTSLEENGFYHEQIKAIFPECYLKFVDFVLRDRVEANFNGLQGCFYKDLPMLEYDFIFIDAPTIQKNKESVRCFNADLINLLEANMLGKFDALLDQRISTMWAYKRLLKEVKIVYHPINKLAKISKE